MDQQTETELRERDERAPEHELAETPAEERAEPDEAAPQDEAPPPKKKRSLLLVGLLIAAGAIAGGGYLYFSTRDIQSTDDAYTDGRAVTIAPQVSGLVVSLDVNDNQFVHKGEAADPYRSAAIYSGARFRRRARSTSPRRSSPA